MILNSLIQKIKNLFIQNKPYSYFVVSIILIVFVYMALKIELLERNFFLSSYSPITISYTQHLIKSAELILNSMGSQTNINYVRNTFQVIGSMSMNFDYQIPSLTQIIILLLIGLIIPVKIKHKLIYIIAGLLFIHIFNIVRFATMAYFNNGFYAHTYFFLILFRQILSLSLLFFIYICIEKNLKIKNYLVNKLNSYNINYFFIYWKIAAIKAVLIVLSYEGITYALSSGILNISHLMLSMAGYFTIIKGWGLESSLYPVLYLVPGCIGLNMMGVFVFVIMLVHGKVWTKMWFIIFGCIMIYFINAVRISFIYTYLLKHRVKVFDIHDWFTYPVYLFIFILWVIWINRFVKKVSV